MDRDLAINLFLAGMTTGILLTIVAHMLLEMFSDNNGPGPGTT